MDLSTLTSLLFSVYTGAVLLTGAVVTWALLSID